MKGLKFIVLKIPHILIPAVILFSGVPAIAQVDDPHAGHVMTTVDDTGHQEHSAPVAAPDTQDHAGHLDQDVDNSPASAGMEPVSPNMATSAAEKRSQGGNAPPDARDPHAYSGGFTLTSGPYALSGSRQLVLADEHKFYNLRANRFENVNSDDGTFLLYDVQGWFGTTFKRLVLKAEGEYSDGRLEESSTEFLYSRAINSFWDAQVGLRADNNGGPDKQWLALGIQGLARYWFEVDATAYLGDDGDTAFSVEAEYEFLFTQRLILQPRAELNFYGSSDEIAGIGSGLSDAEIGLRLRYEFSRQFAPYIGIERTKKFGETADLARAGGDPTGDTRVIAGFRIWF